MKIVLDPGHGGADPGAVVGAYRESVMVLGMQPFFWKALADQGHCVTTTRVKDTKVPLESRVQFANHLGADLFISLHLNASADTAAHGPWTLYAKPSAKSLRLARSVHRQIAAVANLASADAYYPDDEGWTGGRSLFVLRRTAMPALLLELGFLTSELERKLLLDEAYVERLAVAVARGIASWIP
jgi:N-acetylmuramoyl-L-alanine amidase